MSRRIRLTGTGVRLPGLVLMLAALALVGTACEEGTGTDLTAVQIDPGATVPGDDVLPLDTLPAEETTESVETTQPAEATDTTAADASATITEVASADGRFSILLELVDDAGLTDMLSGSVPITLFAPTDQAFAAIPVEELSALRTDSTTLSAVLQSHIFGADLAYEDLISMATLAMTSGVEYPILLEGSGLMIGDAEVVEPDISASNGRIHVIDTVLIEDPEG